MKQIKKGLKVLLLTALAYLVQVCVMEHLKISGITGSVIFSVLAIFIVSLGKKYAFCASCIIGMVMESMLSNVPALYVIAYPVVTMLFARLFADLDDQQMEKKRAAAEDRKNNRIGRRRLLTKIFNAFEVLRPYKMKPEMRILYCAGMMDLLFNGVMAVYMYLIGVEFNFYQIWKMIISLVYTEGICLILMFPLRRFLGVGKWALRRSKGGEWQ